MFHPPPFKFSQLLPFQSHNMKNQMDQRLEALSSIIHGCELAKELETNLQTLATQQSSLFSSCEEISRAFNKAMNLLNPHHPLSYTHMIFGGTSSESSSRAQNMERSDQKQAMDLFYGHTLAVRSPFHVQLLPERTTGETEPLPIAAVAREAETSAPSRPGGEFHSSDTSDSGRSSLGGTSVQRSRRRKESPYVHTVRVSAPSTGNLEIPPDDGFTWRKYGQKEILNSRFPRSYYRCTHKSFYGCDAKKQVQRLDDDPSTFEVMYRGHHTCQTSPTPLILPSPEITKQEMPETTQPCSVSTSIHLGIWFPRELEVAQKDKNTLMDSSHVRGGKEMESGCPVVDLADAMFNSGSSSNSMDAIFSSNHDN